MPVCAGQLPYLDGIEFVWVTPVNYDTPMPPADCVYKFFTAQEVDQMVEESAEMNALILPLALVVIFVLGWIAGAQR